MSELPASSADMPIKVRRITKTTYAVVYGLSFGLVIVVYLAVLGFIVTQAPEASGNTSFLGKSFAAVGVFGDSFGAVNAFFSALAFAAVAATLFLSQAQIGLQQEELAAVLEEHRENVKAFKDQNAFLDKQMIVNRFYRQLEGFQTLTNNLKLFRPDKRGGKTLQGQDIFDVARSDLKRMVARNPAGDNVDAAREYKSSLNVPSHPNEYDPDAIKENYLLLYKGIGDYESVFAQYYRTFYHLVRFVDDQATERLPPLEKYELVRIARASLSQDELIMIAINCLTNNGENMWAYVERYDILNNIEDSKLWKSIRSRFESVGTGEPGFYSRREDCCEPLSKLKGRAIYQAELEWCMGVRK
ncbi:MAG: putative phage abortive infection protein [Planctomycetota bacterium]